MKTAHTNNTITFMHEEGDSSKELFAAAIEALTGIDSLMWRHVYIKIKDDRYAVSHRNDRIWMTRFDEATNQLYGKQIG